jgi:hypothetical protein
MIEKKYWPWIGFGVAVIAVMIWQQRKIIRQAKKFLGVSEIGDNMDWDNPEFKKKLQAVGWAPGSQWCVYFAKAMMVDVYPELKTKTHKGKKLMDYISGNSQQTYSNMKTLETETGGMFKIVAVPRAGDIVIWQNYGTDSIPTTKGHVGIVTLVKGDSFKTIEGNAQPLDSLVLTPKGFVKMGDLKVGDELVSINGEKSFVKAIYPQGKRPIYEMTMNDLSKVKCSDNHLWKVNNGKEYVFDTLTLIKKIKNKPVYRIPSIPKIDFKPIDLPIHPYVFGLLIGNGNLRLSGSKFATADQFVIDKFEEIYIGCKLKKVKAYDFRIIFPDQKDNPIMKGLRDLNYFFLCYDKHIPEEYKYTSFDNRLELLQGLIDTDGHIDKLGRIEYTTTSIRLIQDIQWLVHSLGGRARIQTKEKVFFTSPNQLVKKQAHVAYRVAIILPIGIDPCKQPRKLVRYKKNKLPVERSFKYINYIGEEECQCISVTAKDNLYITDNFIPTHNTSELGNNEEGVNKKDHSLGEYKKTKGLRLKGFVRYTLK